MAQFITDVFLVSSKGSDSSKIILDTTVNGGDANLYESSWRHKGKRLIGFKRDDQDEFVVTDITIVLEDEDIPDEYVGCLITTDTNEKGLKKHILCYTRNPRKTSANGISEIILVNNSEQTPPYFTSIGDKINDIKICFKTEPLPKPKPPPRVPTSSVEQQQYQQHSANDSAHKSPVSGIEGVPFQINPKYNTSSSGDPIINSISVVSIEEMMRKYQYSFNTERETINAT